MYFGGGATKGVQVNILYRKNYIVYRQICDILKFAHTWVIGEVDSIIKWVLEVQCKRLRILNTCSLQVFLNNFLLIKHIKSISKVFL